MQLKGIVQWVVDQCTELRRSQAKTLGELVCGTMRCRRVSQADIGRSMCTRTVAKHNVKRAYRFVANHRVEAVDACRALVGLAIRAAAGRLLVALDWVDIGPYKVLKAAVPVRGRAVPVLFAAYRKWQVHKSQNAFEEGLLCLLATMVPAGVQVVVLADRGFHRAELARRLQQLGLSYVIRISTRVTFSSPVYSGSLDDLPVAWGTHKDLGFGQYRKSRPVRQRVVVYWRPRAKEPWFLATDVEWGWRKVVGAYGLRMSIEELFRDEKNVRFGWGLRQTKVSDEHRLERLLLILAFAYLLLILIGKKCREQYSPGHWASGVGRRRQASDFFVGRYMQVQVRFRMTVLMRLLADTLRTLAQENWG